MTYFIQQNLNSKITIEKQNNSLKSKSVKDNMQIYISIILIII